MIRGALQALETMLFPPHCLLSGRFLGTEQTDIPEIGNAELLHHEPAPRGAVLLEMALRHFHGDDFALSSVNALWAVRSNSQIDGAIHAIKYHSRCHLAQALGARLADHPEISLLPQDALVCPIPIHKARERERGYNQAEHIAIGFTQAANRILTNRGTVVRTRYTETQTNKTEKQRAVNVHSAFRVQDSDGVRGRTILLVDDVFTTGATMNSCATALLEAGAVQIHAVALCAAV